MNILKFVILVLVLTSCNKRLEKAMKETDPNKIMEVADKFSSEKKYSYAITLYEKMIPLVAGTDLAPEVAYKSAEANFNYKNYTLAAHQYKNFHNGFNKDSRSEQALYLSAICYYKSSPEYNLDPTNTNNALKELQNFIDTYPNSEKIKECNLLIDELRIKLEDKAFENAKTLYKTMKYKAASVSFENMISDFPDSKLKEDTYYYSLISKYELSKNSIFNLKKERLIEAKTAVKLIIKEFPNTKYKDEVTSLESKIEKLIVEHDKINNQLIEQSKKITSTNNTN